MTFSSSTDPKVLAAELALLESLTAKAIAGNMNEPDFKELNDLFFQVKKAEYRNYIKEVVPNLSDENLHKLIAGLLKEQAKSGANNTFLRDDSILKGLLVEEARRHGLKVTYPPLVTPETIPNAILDHYARLIDESPAVFNGSKGQEDAATRCLSMKNSIIFNILNSLVLEAIDHAEPAVQLQIGAQLQSSSLVQAEKFYANVNEKVKVENDKVKVEVPPLTFTPVLAPEDAGSIAKKIAHNSIVACSKNQSYQSLLTNHEKGEQFAEIEKQIKTYYNNPFAKKVLSDLVKEHQALRKELGITYELGEESAAYKLLMSGNENTIARQMHAMIEAGDMNLPQNRNDILDISKALADKSPPELWLKMQEIADKLESRKSGKVGGFESAVNKFVNAIKWMFRVKDKDIKEAFSEMKAAAKGSEERVAEEKPAERADASHGKSVVGEEGPIEVDVAERRSDDLEDMPELEPVSLDYEQVMIHSDRRPTQESGESVMPELEDLEDVPLDPVKIHSPKHKPDSNKTRAEKVKDSEKQPPRR